MTSRGVYIPHLLEGRPARNVKSYTPNTARFLAATVSMIEVRMCTKRAVPTGDERDEDVLWALKAVKTETGEQYELQSGARTYLENQYSRVRQDAHNYAKASVPPSYQLNRLSASEIAERVKLLIEDDNYLYRAVDGDQRDAQGRAEVHGPYDHVAARDIIINFAFDGSDSPGARRPAVFDPLPLTLLAWGYTVIYHVLKEWESGTYMTIRFSAENLIPIYARILTSLEKFATGDRGPELLAVRKSILDHGHVSARIEAEADQGPISIR